MVKTAHRYGMPTDSLSATSANKTALLMSTRVASTATHLNSLPISKAIQYVSSVPLTTENYALATTEKYTPSTEREHSLRRWK